MKRVGLALLLAGCATTAPPPKSTITVAPPATRSFVQEGLGTFYGKEAHGGPTASGERFDMWAMTAAHKTLRLGTRIRVTNMKNGRSVVLRVNDRGPYAKGRIVDVSFAAARALGMVEAGVVPVRVEVVH